MRPIFAAEPIPYGKVLDREWGRTRSGAALSTAHPVVAQKPPVLAALAGTHGWYSGGRY